MAYGSIAGFWYERQTVLFQAVLGLMLGFVAGGVVAFGAGIEPAIGAGLAVGVPAMLLFLLRPAYGFYAFVFAVLVLEEFPSVSDWTAERSMRTAFYGRSIGIPGLFAPDMLLLGLLGLFFVYRMLAHRERIVRVDWICISLASLMAMVGVSAAFSMAFGNPASGGMIEGLSGIGIEINERAARLVPFFQIKIYLYLFLAYLVASIVLDSPKKLREVLWVSLAAVCVVAVIGAVRLARAPNMVADLLPLFYDTAAIWIFALVAFFTVMAWAQGLLKPHQTAVMTVLSFVLMLWVLLSFRRTMWGAVVVAAPLLLFFMPRRKRMRLVVLGFIGMVLCLVAVAVTPAGPKVYKAVATRLSETTGKEYSTLYRQRLFSYFANNWSDVPLLGYGVTPLWNVLVDPEDRRTNLENIHSLYFWILLRTGIVGCLVALAVVISLIVGIVRFVRGSPTPLHKVVGVCVLLAGVMLLFSGLFNPVYALARYMILLGFMLALITRMREFDRQTLQTAAAEPALALSEPCQAESALRSK